MRSTRFERETSNASAIVFVANRPVEAMANARSVFFVGELHSFAQNLDFKRLLAKDALKFADLLLEIADFGGAYDVIVSFDGFSASFGHTAPPVE